MRPVEGRQFSNAGKGTSSRVARRLDARLVLWRAGARYFQLPLFANCPNGKIVSEIRAEVKRNFCEVQPHGLANVAIALRDSGREAA